jgi:hypothetical protein
MSGRASSTDFFGPGPTRLALYVPRDLARHRAHDSHRLVTEIGRGIEHQWTTSVDHFDTLLSSRRGRRIRDAPIAEGSVHPYPLHAQVGALAHRVLGDLWPGSDYDGIDPPGDRLQILITGIALDFVGVWVDREDVIPSVT